MNCPIVRSRSPMSWCGAKLQIKQNIDDRSGWTLPPLLEQLKPGDSFLIQCHDLTIEDRGAQFQFFGRISDARELGFKRQSIPRPDTSFGTRSLHRFYEFGERPFHACKN